MSFKHALLSFVNSPEQGVRSSQTLYEALFFTLEMHQIEPDATWLDQARNLAELICAAQLEDGGFDIGYSFQFGASLRKTQSPESTSPELVSITALGRYLHFTGDDRVVPTIERGLQWIRRHLVQVEDGVAIPYAPVSSRSVHITNATSFAVAALATAVGLSLGSAEDVESIHNMYAFMASELERDSHGGAHWPYFARDARVGPRAQGNDKVDNYHIGQQLFHHCVANESVPDPGNAEVIREVSKYLVAIQQPDGFIPYSFRNGKASDAVDVWGFASVVPGLLEADAYTERDGGRDAAALIAAAVMKHHWNGSFFLPIVHHPSWRVLDDRYYPRSDAWVLHALAHHQRASPTKDDTILDHFRTCFERLLEHRFTGLENHTLTWRKRAFGTAVQVARGLGRGT